MLARTMARYYIGGFIGGLLLAALAALLWPLPEHHRFRSLIDVLPNGGRAETFVIRWPQDRLELPGDFLVGDRVARAAALGLMVLEDERDGRVSAELFRLRDSAGNVIGVAARMAIAPPAGARSTTDWLLVIPSRGSLALRQLDSRDLAARRISRGGASWASPALDDSRVWAGRSRMTASAGPVAGMRGSVLHGNGEFRGMTGRHTETWTVDERLPDGFARGRILIETEMQRSSE
ncbi:MAG: hypothetical protein JJT85_08415 [Chromatiales bacterium]|nr:hypothetical protein [Chromatiales bacterium]